MLTAEPLLSVAEMTAWLRLPAVVVKHAEDLASRAWDVRQALRGVYTTVPIGIYLDNAGEKAAMFVPDAATAVDVALVKSAVSRVVDLPEVGFCWSPTMKSGSTPELCGYTKVAYSPFLRAAGEYLNFFPGKYPGGIPNSPGPVQSMLTSGLVGAGLGYAGGWAAEQLMPDEWKRGRLRKTLAALGGAAGAVPGAVWGASNLYQGKGFNDNSVLNHPAGASPAMNQQDLGVLKGAGDKLSTIKLGTRYTSACQAYADKVAADTLVLLKEAFGDSFATDYDSAAAPSPMSVNVDAMGRTLWETGASPQTAGMTMGALAAAQQMPGGEEPGFVTPLQMANLAAHMGAGYLSGAVVGATLGLLTGMPAATQDTLKRTGMYLGVVRSVVPKLFGQG